MMQENNLKNKLMVPLVTFCLVFILSVLSFSVFAQCDTPVWDYFQNTFVCDGIPIEKVMGEVVGDGGANNPYRWEGSVIGMTSICTPRVWSTSQKQWLAVSSGQQVESIKVVGNGLSGPTDPLRVEGSSKGLLCTVRAGGEPEVNIVYWNPTAGGSEESGEWSTTAVTTSGTPSAGLTHPTPVPTELITFPSVTRSQLSKEIDEAWLEVAKVLNLGSTLWEPQSGRWGTEGQLYPGERITAGGDSTTLLGFPTWCAGNEGLPSTELRERIQTKAWKSEGKTYEQLAVEVGQQNGVHPALLATHMQLESSVGKSNSCTNLGKSALTGCGWSNSSCSANVPSSWTESDRAQLVCSATKTYVRNGRIGGGSYQDCIGLDTEKMWNCIFCKYQGNYNIDKDKKGLYFTKDGTCTYANNFKETFCPWQNYFAQKGIGTASAAASGTDSATASSATPAAFTPATGYFKFIVVSDYHEGDDNRNNLITQIISQRPAFVIFNGDSINALDSYQQDWTNFFNQVVTPLKNAGIPVFHVLGNHDYEKNEEMRAYHNQAWKNFYSNNAALYNHFSNFNYQNTFPYYSFDYNGKRFLVLNNPDYDINSDSAQLSWLRSNMQGSSFLFSHTPIVYYWNSKFHETGSAEILRLINQHNSIFFSGHLHYYYKTNYQGNNNQYNIPLVFVSTAKSVDNRGIAGTFVDGSGYRGNDEQPASFVVVEVSRNVVVSAYIKEGNNYREFASADEQKYFPSGEKLGELRIAGLYPFSYGVS